MNLLTLKEFDEILDIIEKPTGDDGADEIFHRIAQTIKALKQGQLNLINHLLRLYDQAAEHNIDVSRRHIFDLAQQLAGVEPQSTSGSQAEQGLIVAHPYNTRRETGPVQFGEKDWPGVFIRGDNALAYAAHLTSLIEGEGNTISVSAIEGLRDDLLSCNVTTSS